MTQAATNAHTLIAAALSDIKRGRTCARWYARRYMVGTALALLVLAWYVYVFSSLAFLQDGTIVLSELVGTEPSGTQTFHAIVIFMGRVLCPAVLFGLVCGCVSNAAKRMVHEKERAWLDGPYDRFDTLKLMAEVLPDEVMDSIRQMSARGIVTNYYVESVLKHESTKCVGSALQRQRAILLNNVGESNG